MRLIFAADLPTISEVVFEKVCDDIEKAIQESIPVLNKYNKMVRNVSASCNLCCMSEKCAPHHENVCLAPQTICFFFESKNR